jgi:hypothetical protein
MHATVGSDDEQWNQHSDSPELRLSMCKEAHAALAAHAVSAHLSPVA